MTAHESTAAWTKKSKTSQWEDAMTQASTTQTGSKQADNKNAIRPFNVNVSEADLTELRRRINATKWPERETVSDASQGVQLATIQALAHYWETDYDWRKIEAKLNALPQFIAEIDGLDIHFIHVRSKHENALPLIVTHGWPGSIIELYPAPRSWTQQAYAKPVHFNKLDKGGHFAAFEQPQLLSEEVRAGFRSLHKATKDKAA